MRINDGGGGRSSDSHSGNNGSADAATESGLLYSHGVPFIHRPHNGHLCPTVIIPNWSALETGPGENDPRTIENVAIGFVRTMISRLQREIREGGWQVMQGVFLFKGLNSTRRSADLPCGIPRRAALPPSSPALLMFPFTANCCHFCSDLSAAT